MTEQALRQAETVRDILRRQTDAAHQQLHHHSSFVALFDGALSLDGYRALMKRMYGFYAPLDQAIGAALSKAQTARGRDAPAPYDHVRRSDFLALDMHDFGYDELALRALPTCAPALHFVTPTTVGGVLYVIEGATLGASQIDRAAQKLLSADVTDGRRFWAWCRAQNKQRWSMANAHLEVAHADGATVGELTAGAQQTFEALAEWLAPLHNDDHHLAEATS